MNTPTIVAAMIANRRSFQVLSWTDGTWEVSISDGFKVIERVSLLTETNAWRVFRRRVSAWLDDLIDQADDREDTDEPSIYKPEAAVMYTGEPGSGSWSR